MYITRVELRNIKRHAERVFLFQPGVVAICGPNGSGKSTILEAIAWVLFDHLEYRREDFLQRGARKGQATIGFQSDLDGREYHVTRDTSGGYFVYDPITQTRLVEQKGQVLPWLRQRLGVDAETDLPSLFRSTLGVPQGAFTYDFGLAPTQRKAVFDQILKVEEYRQASDQLRGTQRLVEGRVTEAERQLAGYEGELRGYGGLVEGIAEVEAELANVRRAQEEGETERERLRERSRGWGQLTQEIEAQARVSMEGKLALATRREAYAGMEALAAQAREAAAIVRRSQAGAERYVETGQELARLDQQRQERDQQRARLAEVERRRVESDVELRQLEARLAEVSLARAEVAQLTVAIERQEALERSLAEAQEARGEWQSLQRSRDTLDEELKGLRARYQVLSGQIEQAMAEAGRVEALPDLEREQATLEAETRQAAVAEERRRLKREERERLAESRTRAIQERDRLEAELADLEEQALLARELPAKEDQHQTLSARLSQASAELLRDREMIAALDQGGLCPLLTERCLNLRPGESVETKFRDGLDRRASEVECFREELARGEHELQSLRQAVLRAARLPECRESWSVQTDRLRSLERQEQELTKEISALDASLSTQEMARRRERLKQLAIEVRVAREAQRQLDRAEVLRQEQAQILAEGEVKRAAFDQLQARLEALGDPEKRIQEARDQLERLADPRGRAQGLRRMMARAEEWEAIRDQTRRGVEEASAACQELELALQAYASLGEEIAAITARRAQFESDHFAYLAHRSPAETLAAREEDLSRLEAEVELLAQQQSLVDARLEELEATYDREAHRRDAEAYDRCRERLAVMATRRVSLEGQLDGLVTERARLEVLRERAAALAQDRATLLRLRERTELIRDLLVRAAPYITESYLHSISHEANQLYREITGRYDVTLRWNRDYEITLEEGVWTRPFQTLSGGEQMAAALAVRLALLRELSEIRIAFFDEPTTNLDEERRRSLALHLGRIHDFQQLFVISHDDSFEGLTDQQIQLGESVAN